jgi:hypothetical protein
MTRITLDVIVKKDLEGPFYEAAPGDNLETILEKNFKLHPKYA